MLGGIASFISKRGTGDLVEIYDGFSGDSVIVLVILTFLFGEKVVFLCKTFFSLSFSFIVLNGENG